jgi:hypothetical protein
VADSSIKRKRNPVTANEFVEQKLHESLHAIEQVFSCHALSFFGPLLEGVDDILRNTIEQRCCGEPKTQKLVVLLTTTGGYLEPVQRMVATIRHHYQTVFFVIPNYAYSAGTVFALSGDAIYMDYYSRLGPIDPQIPSTRSKRMVSALGYLEKYNELIAKSQKGEITAAEVEILMEGFDQAELYSIEQARDLSIAALEEWLVQYKFKNWKKTETHGIPVTPQMRKDRASQIGKQLNDTKKWHSHGYGISMDVLRKDLNLVIDDFGADKAMSSVIKPYHDLLSDYMVKRDNQGVVHVYGRYSPFM